MSGRQSKFGIHATLVPKPDQIQTVRDFLAGGKAIVDAEPDTLQWYGYKLDDMPDGTIGAFGIFDTFPHTDGRDTHIGGEIPKALIPKVPELLNAPPAIDPVDILAEKVSKNAAKEGNLKFAVQLLIKAKPESVALVKSTLAGSYFEGIKAEAVTDYWYAFQKDETTFGLFGAFDTAEHRSAHLNGTPVAETVSAITALVAEPLNVQLGEVIAFKTHG